MRLVIAMLLFVLVLSCAFCLAFVEIASANEWGSPVDADTMIVVIIDGIRADNADTMLARLDDSLMAWGAASFPNFETRLDAYTDPRHASLLTGHHETLDSCCCNAAGVNVNPTIIELLDQRGMLVTAKEHLSNTIIGVDHNILVDLGTIEGPDSLTYSAFNDSFATILPAYSLLELARYDKRAHIWTMSNYYNDLALIASQAADVVLDLVASRAGGRTVVFVTTDHGRHNDGANNAQTRHGHTPCGAALCSGCDDIWLYAIGSGVTGGVYSRAYTHENLAATAMLLFGLPVTSTALPITDCFE